jgi:hypothetical protein
LETAVDRRLVKPRSGPPKDHFEKLLEAPYRNHEGPVKHALKDCNLMKSFLARMMKNKVLDGARASGQARQQ